MQQLSHSAVEPELDTRRPRRRTQRSGGGGDERGHGRRKRRRPHCGGRRCAHSRGAARVLLRVTLAELVDAAAGIHDRSEEHTSELQSLMRISYAVFCLKKQHIMQTITQTKLHNTSK